jgi:hypothetical protein
MCSLISMTLQCVVTLLFSVYFMSCAGSHSFSSTFLALA